MFWKKKEPMIGREPMFNNRLPRNVAKANMLVEEIHNSFEVASELALAEAKAIIASCEAKHKPERVDRLKKLGFTSMQEVKEEHELQTQKLNALTNAKRLEDWTQKYPQYKFITKEAVVAICKKYGLICGPVNIYKGDIPEKNLMEIENFKVDDDDIYTREVYLSSWMSSGYRTIFDSEVDLVPIKRKQSSSRNYSYSDVPLYICAPAKDMDLTNYRTNEFGQVIAAVAPDPVVLHYVKGGFLIVSKWGIEGEDPSLTNEKMN